MSRSIGGPGPIAPGRPVTSTAMHRLATVPHRFFFLAGMVQVSLVSLWWLWSLAARAVPGWPALPTAYPETALHALLMIDGFLPLFMFGFLFTAGPRWLRVAPPSDAAWRPPGLVAFGGALGLLLTQVAGAPEAVRIAAGIYLLGWLWLAALFLWLLWTSPERDRVHATVVLAALLAGASTLGAFALFGTSAHPWVKAVGVGCFLVPVFVTVCHRMIPFFTAGSVPQLPVFRPRWLLATMVGAPVLHALIDGAGFATWTWIVDLPAAAVVALLVWKWGLVQSLKNHLLAMLHLGFAWYAIGLALAGIDALLQLYGHAGIGLAPLHALTIGFCTSLLMAMVTRVSCGHSGRMLAADAMTWRLFQVLQVSAAARLLADFGFGHGWLMAAIVLWCASLLPWAAKYGPVYWRPRADGRPG